MKSLQSIFVIALLGVIHAYPSDNSGDVGDSTVSVTYDSSSSSSRISNPSDSTLDMTMGMDDLFGRAAGQGQSKISTSDDSKPTGRQYGGAIRPPFPGMGGPSVGYPAQQPENHQGGYGSGPTGPTGDISSINPDVALEFLYHVSRAVQTFPRSLKTPGGEAPSGGSCDLKSYKHCTCVSPAVFTKDGRGNCNLGVTKPDQRVWCYVSHDYGHPQSVCPDATASKAAPGQFWSRFACITG
eukprot:TCALIF_09112-PA protein Name:"Protein of unknown function" AED:0.15 eAED:0.23 QI:0/-1/0/1/-1/1/1/0/239